MGDKRRLLSSGDMLLLGGTKYRLEAVVGCGGSTVVYRASYKDQLNQECRHYVLIKELFPYHPKGDIYRNASNEICCRGDGVRVMERHRQNFYRGNQANLKLLEQAPEKVSGNLNSYRAYGTFYSVLAVHGGKNLETVLASRQELGTLKDMAETVLKILEAVVCFHESGILHLDISPDNIVMLPEQALLIDYNSVWLMDGQETQEYCFSEKEGYSAPEVRLRERKNISPATDLYSVCAVWFRMLTGRVLTDEDIVENKIRKSLSRDLDIFSGEPVAIIQKTVQIVTKGLHVLARRRYQNVAQMREDVLALLQLLEAQEAARASVKKRKIICYTVLAALILFTTGSLCVWKARQPYQLNAQERYQLKEVLYQVGRNLGALGIQLEIQQQVLENAAQKEVLERDRDAVEQFYEKLSYKRNEARHYQFDRSDDKDALEMLDIPKADLPVSTLEELLDKTYDMDLILEEGLGHLEEGFGMTALSYTEREELVGFYQAYLDAYAEVTYRELCLVMVRLDAESAEEMLDIMTQVSVLRDYISVCPYEGKSVKILETELAAAKARMKRCMNDMRSRNYVITAQGWQ